jgi:TM2 domain-containing membrane protein YozV
MRVGSVFLMASLFLFTLQNELCSNRGNIDKNTDECVCSDGYVTFPLDQPLKCNYEKKSQSIAVVLSIFGGIFGVDMFYLGYNMKGFFKCLFPILIAMLFIIFREYFKGKFLQRIHLFFPFVVIFVMWFYDIWQFSSDNCFDSNGIAMIK